MELTPFGLLVLPITCLLVPFDPRRLLVWTIILAPFEAASVLNLDLSGFEFGIQPGYLAAAAFLTAATLRWLLERQPAVLIDVRLSYLPLFLFAAVAVAGAIVLPSLFAGQVLVFPPREGLTLSSLAPLEPSGTNLTQSAYIVFLCAFALAASHTVARPSTVHPRSPLTAYMITGMFVVALGLYQLLAFYGGLPYPEDLLYSNPVYYQGFQQTIGTIKRMTSTFTEPSSVAYYLAGVFGFGLARYLQSDRPLRPGVVTFAALVGLILSTSATAYATASIVVLVAAIAVPARGRATRLVALGGMAAVTLGALVPWVLRQAPAQVTADLALINVAARVGTVSFVDRIGSDLHSLGLVPATFGLGVGWGANRASSLVTTLLSTVGIAGVALLGWFAWRVVRLVRARLNEAQRKAESGMALGDPELAYVAPLSLSLVAMLVAGAIAVPDINHVAFWVNLALLLGILARAAPGRGPSAIP